MFFYDFISLSNRRILRFRRDEIIAWMMAKRQETKQEFIESMELGFAARLRK